MLSGFLITSLLLAEWLQDSKLHLGNFWARRARRLLPALFVLVIVAAIYEAAVGSGQAVPGFLEDGLSTLFYIGNWHQIWTGSGYFAQAAQVSPLQQTWSLAIEEQFYLLWPLLLVGLLAGGRRLAARRGARRHVALAPALVVCILGALASAVEMAWLFHGGTGLNRVYYGTDTRAQGLLAGGAMAVVLAMRRASRTGSDPLEASGRSSGHLPALAGVAGAVAAGVLIAQAGTEPAWLFKGGMLVFDLAVLGVIWAAITSNGRLSPVRQLLSLAPLRGVGLISYGLYLWHFPLYLWLTAASTGIGGGALLGLRLVVTLCVALVSFVVVEQPIRRRRLPTAVVRVALPATGALAVTALLLSSAVGASVGVPIARGPAPGPTVAVGSSGPQHCEYRVPPYNRLAVFHTCPPIRVMLVGDSIGLTLGIEITLNEHRYGILVDNEAILGCSFSTRGLSDPSGTGYLPLAPGCRHSLSHWRAVEERHNPSVVIVEMGYWDELNWRWHNRDVALGNRAYMANERTQIDKFATALAAGGRQVVLVSVPLVDPTPWPNGSQPPQSSARRNAEMNALLASAARHLGPRVHFFNLAPYVTPSGRYAADIGGSICRMPDGVHFWIGPPGRFEQSPCGIRVQAALLNYVRQLSSHPR
ncbi:MAG: acyltransferase family protein [Acidimicrobiales bacterium]